MVFVFCFRGYLSRVKTTRLSGFFDILGQGLDGFGEDRLATLSKHKHFLHNLSRFRIRG